MNSELFSLILHTKLTLKRKEDTVLKQKLDKFLSVAKKEAMPACFSLICGWLVTLSTFLIKETIAKPAEEALSYTSVATKNGETLVNGYADIIVHEHLWLFIFLLIGVAAALFCVNKFLYKKTLIIALPVSFLVYGFLAIYNSSSSVNERAFPAIAFIVLAALVILLCANYIKNQRLPIPTNDISPKCAIAVIIVAFVALSAIYIYMLWAKTASYSAPGFDMGIFAQMFDNMTDGSHSFLPMVTCERNELLSHFAVHFSPILYLLAPFCFIFNPLTVMIFAQILIAFCGVFPLYLICRQLKLSYIKSTIISLLYLLYPAMSSGACSEFHENVFLAPLILWTLYFSHKRGALNTALMFVFALLTLMVKEDAALYVGFIALFIFFSQRQRLKGVGMLAMTVCYFLIATHIMAQIGQSGAMLNDRYGNIIGQNEGYSSLITAFLTNPALYAAEMFSAEKLVYALNMLLPLAFLPLITRKPSRFLLIAPFIIINLVTGWQHQYDLGYQYSFGSGALLLYLTALNVAELSFAPSLICKDESRLQKSSAESEPINNKEISEPINLTFDNDDVSDKNDEKKISSKNKLINNLTVIAIIFAIFASIFTMAGRMPAQSNYVKIYNENEETYEIIEDTLSKIDRSKSVLASSKYLTHLYDVDELYSATYGIVTDKIVTINYFTDVVVLDARGLVDTIVKKYKLYRYEVVEEHEGIIIVLERTESSPPVGPAQK